MWNLKEEEIARRILASELPGIWNHDLPVSEGMVGLLLVNEKLDRVYGPGTLRVSSGLAQFFGLGTKNAVVLARAHELSLDFPIAHVLTRDPVFLDFNCQLLLKLQPGAETLFLRNILAGRDSLTFDGFKQRLSGELKEVAQSFLGKRSIAELADHLEIKPELEAEIELNLKRTLASSGLTFIGLRTADFRCPAWDRRKEGEVLITETQATLEGKKRLAEVFTQTELSDLAEETRKVEQHEQRLQLWDRMRRAAQSDKMNEVRSEQDLDEFLRGIDKDKLLKESEFEEFKRSLRDKLDDRERTRDHVVRIAELKNEYEYKNQELSLRSGYTQAQQQIDAELQAKRLEAELKHLDLELAIRRKKDEAMQAALQMESQEAASRRSQELSDVQHQTQIEDVHQVQEAKKRAQERLERAEAEKLDLESRERKMRLELDWYHTLDTMSPETKVLVADSPQKVDLLAGLAKIKAQASLSTEQLLAMAVAAGNSSQAADVLKTLVTKASSMENNDLFERRVSEQKEARGEVRAMSESFIKAQQELFNKTLETLAQIAQAKGKEKTG